MGRQARIIDRPLLLLVLLGASILTWACGHNARVEQEVYTQRVLQQPHEHKSEPLHEIALSDVDALSDLAYDEVSVATNTMQSKAKRMMVGAPARPSPINMELHDQQDHTDWNTDLDFISS